MLKLDDHRGRRQQRSALAAALYTPNSSKRALFAHLTEIAALVGADRAAAVWLDEYGSGLVHPHVVVDLLSDRPRRGYLIEPLRKAWDLGLPGTYEGTTGGNSLAVALGSDGTRAWFLVADSVAGRGRLEKRARERLLFLAGECSAIVLHRDLDEGRSTSEDAVAGGSHFAGWAILQDLEGRETDRAARGRIEQRFTVARLVRMVVDEDLAVSAERLKEHVSRARDELKSEGADFIGEEAPLWEQVLDALEREDLDRLARAVLQLAEAVDACGHAHGAIELYACAHEVAAAAGASDVAVDACRLRARLHRRRARWDEAVRWYSFAQEIAEASDLDDRVARVMSGLAVIRREMGNLPAAREGLRRALTVAERCNDADALASVHHEFLSLEHAAGNLAVGLEHGWTAVATYRNETGRMRCLAGLAGALVEFGDRGAAEDAWTVVAARSDESYYRLYAHDALAYLAALRGDSAEFESQAAKCDALGWEAGPLSAKAEILHYRGLGYRALGRISEAEEWLGRAVAFAEEHGFNRTLFEAERALEEVRESVVVQDEPEPAAPTELKVGLREMRRAAVTVGV